VHEESVTLYGKAYRALVVHSSAHDKRRQKRLERELEASLKQIKGRAKTCEKRVFSCQAEAGAAEALAEDTAYHRLEIRVVEQPRYAQGRPRKNSPRIPVAIEYGLQAKVIEKQAAIERHRKHGETVLHNLFLQIS
jgi:hypothetical protein